MVPYWLHDTAPFHSTQLSVSAAEVPDDGYTLPGQPHVVPLSKSHPRLTSMHSSLVAGLEPLHDASVKQAPDPLFRHHTERERRGASPPGASLHPFHSDVYHVAVPVSEHVMEMTVPSSHPTSEGGNCEDATNLYAALLGWPQNTQTTRSGERGR